MAEQSVKVETYHVEYICDKCQVGEMLPTGTVLMSYPAQYPHVCSHCGHMQTFRKSYPTLETK